MGAGLGSGGWWWWHTKNVHTPNSDKHAHKAYSHRACCTGAATLCFEERFVSLLLPLGRVFHVMCTSYYTYTYTICCVRAAYII